MNAAQIRRAFNKWNAEPSMRNREALKHAVSMMDQRMSRAGIADTYYPGESEQRGFSCPAELRTYLEILRDGDLAAA